MRNYTNNPKNLTEAVWFGNHGEAQRLLLLMNPNSPFYFDFSIYTGNIFNVEVMKPFDLACALSCKEFYEDVFEKLAPQQSAERLKEALHMSLGSMDTKLFHFLIKFLGTDDLLNNHLRDSFEMIKLMICWDKEVGWIKPKVISIEKEKEVHNFCNQTVRPMLLRKNLPLDFIDGVCSQTHFPENQMDIIQQEILKNAVKNLAEPNEKKKRKI